MSNGKKWERDFMLLQITKKDEKTIEVHFDYQGFDEGEANGMLAHLNMDLMARTLLKKEGKK